MQTAEATTPIAGEATESREKFARTRAILDSIGPPPFRGTRFDVERLEGSWDEARQHLVELATEMRRRGFDAPPGAAAPQIRTDRAIRPTHCRRHARMGEIGDNTMSAQERASARQDQPIGVSYSNKHPDS